MKRKIDLTVWSLGTKVIIISDCPGDVIYMSKVTKNDNLTQRSGKI